MNILKYISSFQRIFLCKKISADLKSTALSATHDLQYYGHEMRNKKHFWITAKRSYTIPAGVPGSGAGKGGGSGGSVRESGGGLGKYGAAQETGYFLRKQREQLAKIKKKMKQEPSHTDPTQKRKE